MDNRYYPGEDGMDDELRLKSARVWHRVMAAEDMDDETDRNPMPSRMMQEEKKPMPMRTGCMDGSSDQSVQTVKRFILGELSDCHFYSRFAQCAPNRWASQRLMEISAEEGKHARKLIATYYLMTGMNYCPHHQAVCTPMPEYCDGLRMRFTEECQGARSYLEAAEETDDMCMSEMFRNLAEDEYSHAKTLRDLLACEMKV